MSAKWTLAPLASVVCLLFVALPSQGQCVSMPDSFNTLVADGKVIQLTIAASNVFRYVTALTAGRSYSLQTTTDEPHGNAIQHTLVACQFNPSGTATDTSATDPRIVSVISVTAQGGRRISFISGATDNYLFEFRNTDSNSSHQFRAVLEETTQFHPGWSTGGGFNTFYSIQNTTNASCSVTLKLFNLAGTEVATTTQSIAALALLATNTQALGVGAGVAGTGRLTHDCPPGGILVDAAIANFNTSPAAIIPAKFQPAR